MKLLEKKNLQVSVEYRGNTFVASRKNKQAATWHVRNVNNNTPIGVITLGSYTTINPANEDVMGFLTTITTTIK